MGGIPRKVLITVIYMLTYLIPGVICQTHYVPIQKTLTPDDLVKGHSDLVVVDFETPT